LPEFAPPIAEAACRQQSYGAYPLTSRKES